MGETYLKKNGFSFSLAGVIASDEIPRCSDTLIRVQYGLVMLITLLRINLTTCFV